MADLTPADGIRLMTQLINNGRKTVPAAAVESGHRVVEALMPRWTGALAESIETLFQDGKASVFITEDRLKSEQPNNREDRVYLDLHAGEGSVSPFEGDTQSIAGPYPIRIEAFGGPRSGRGQFAWAQARVIVENQITASLFSLRPE